MSVRERRVRDNPPYLEAERQRSRGDREPERQNSMGAAEGNRMIGCGLMTEALIPVSGFPLSGFLPAIWHPWPPPAT